MNANRTQLCCDLDEITAIAAKAYGWPTKRGWVTTETARFSVDEAMQPPWLISGTGTVVLHCHKMHNATGRTIIRKFSGNGKTRDELITKLTAKFREIRTILKERETS